MKTAGIICEYNPFHNGHKYQIAEAKKSFDAVICAMSGSFVQRGDVAIFDKWERTKAALSSGADLVIELPVRTSLSSAEGFAQGAVRLLSSLGVIDSLCFGAETNDCEKLVTAAKIMASEPQEVSEKIKELLAAGVSYPKALAVAYDGIIDDDILSMPNNILALSYIKAIYEQKSNLKPFAIKRKAVGHHDMIAQDGFCSATFLREKIKNGDDISPYTPYDFSSCPVYDLNKLTNAFRHKLITEGSNAFSGISDMEEGLANRFLKALDYMSLSEIIDFVKTKRYTRTRLQRIAVSVLLGLKGNEASPKYIRILGMNKKGIEILSKMKKTCPAPIVNKVADAPNELVYEDILATNLAALCADCIPQNRDYITSPIIIS